MKQEIIMLTGRGNLPTAPVADVKDLQSEQNTKPYLMAWLAKCACKYMCLVLLLMASVFQANAQSGYSIDGPSIVVYGSTHTYTLEGTNILSVTWPILVNGTVVSTTATSIEVQWGTGGIAGKLEADVVWDVNEPPVKVSLPISLRSTLPAAPPTPDDPTIPNFSCGGALLSAANAPSTGTIDWFWQGTNPNGDDNSSGANAADFNFNVYETGTYYLRAYDSSTGLWSVNSSSVFVDIEENETPVMTGPDAVCQGQQFNTFYLSPSSLTGYTWTVSPTNAGNFVLPGRIEWDSEFTGTATITATKTSLFCGDFVANKTVVVNSQPAKPTAPTKTENCGSTKLTMNSAPSGDTYYWQSTANGTETASQNTATELTLYGGSTYYLRAKNNSTDCWSEALVIDYTIKEVPAVPDEPTRTDGCNTNILTRGTPPPGVTWYWQDSADGVSTANSEESINIASGTVYLRAYSNGCWSAARIKTVNSVPYLFPPPMPTIDEECGGTTLTRATPSAGIKYYWQDSADGVEKNNEALQVIRTSPGPYYIRAYIIATDCWSAATVIPYTYKPIPQKPPEVEVTIDCNVATLTRATLPTPHDFTYYWQDTPDGVSTALSHRVVTRDEPGPYYLRAQHTSGCWSEAREVTYTLGELPEAPPAPSVVLNCGNTVITRDTPPAGITYYWQSTIRGDDKDNSDPFINRTSAGTVYLRAVITGTECWSESVMVPYGYKPVPAAPAVPSQVEGDGFTTLTRSAPPQDVTWYWQGTDPNGVDDTDDNLTYTANSSGTYYIRGLHSNGCWGPSTEIEVVTVDDPEIVPGSYVFCKLGDEVLLSVSSEYESYVWKRNGTTVGTESTFLATQTGNYTVTVITITGSQRTSEVAVISGDQALNLGDYNYVLSTTLLDEVSTEAEIDNLNIDKRSVNVQYMDGLGRPWQNVSVAASPLKEHVIQPFVFDELGRQTRQYLPYTTDECNVFQVNPLGVTEDDYVSSPQYLFYQNAEKVAHDVAPYAQALLENSPLNRTLKQGAPGAAWQPVDGSNTDHVVSSAYAVNTSDEVRSFEMLGDGIVFSGSNGRYAAATLMKMSTKDEDQNETIEFTNKSGQVVLKRVATGIIATPWADTYYVYDDFGNLRVVLPPEASLSLESSQGDFVVPAGFTLVTEDLVITSANYTGGSYMYLPGVTITLEPDLVLSPGAKIVPYEFNEEFLNLWAFQYKYDEYNRMTDKRVPGAGWQYMAYDQADRLIASQDANQRATGDYSFTKYDALGRAVLTGIGNHTGTLNNSAEFQAIFDGVGSKLYEHTGDEAVVLGYTNDAAPLIAASNAYETVTYYDGYENLPTGFGLPFVDDFGVGGDPDSWYNEDVKGQVVGAQTKVLDGTNLWLKTKTYYDERYRVIQVQTENRLGGTDRISYQYDFIGRVEKTITTHDDGTPAEDIAITETFTYDHGSRLLEATHKVGDDPRIILVSNEYNALSEVVDKKLHSANSGTGFEQSVDYAYNIRGWLNRINNASLSDGEGDYFGMELGYNQVLAGLGGTALFNGNIAAAKWSNYSGADGMESGYRFAYDGMNRLENADYHEKAAAGLWANRIAFDLDQVTYDLNGNIEALKRYHTNTSTAMDDLSYAYRGNQLLSVTDAGDNADGFKDGNVGSNDYGYDANGNMISDANKDIAAISYNHLNLPEEVTFSGNRSIKYIYDAAGIKLAKLVDDNGTISTTEYTGGFIYEDGTLKQIAHTEGRVRRKDNGDFVYDYYLKDHLGNTRITFTADKPEITYRATMETELAQSEESFFLNIDNLRVSHAGANITGTGNGVTGNEVVRLNGSNANRRLGPGKMLKVTAGDRVDMEVYAYYEGTPDDNSPVDDAIFAALIGNAFGGSATGTEAQQAIQSGFEGNVAMAVPSSGASHNDDVKAYLNYILFSDDFDAIDAGFVRADEGIVEGNHRLLRIQDVAIEQSGFLYVYTSNEMDIGFNVYFDEMELTHRQGGILQEDHYYPFGANINALSSSAPLSSPNKFKYNGNEEQTEFELELFDFNARLYDASLGRFSSVDPLASDPKQYNQSPYQFSWNNPILMSDPTGLCPNGDCETLWELLKSLLGIGKDNASEEELQRDERRRGTYRRLDKKVNDLRDIQRDGIDFIPGGPLINAMIDAKVGGRSSGEVTQSLASAGFWSLVGGAISKSAFKIISKASDDIVGALATKIELSFPGMVKDVERIIKGADGQTLTDFDIELDKYVVEVTGGKGKGKFSQILNKVQPNTDKEVVLFAPYLKTSVMKTLANSDIKVFTDANDLLKFLSIQSVK